MYTALLLMLAGIIAGRLAAGKLPSLLLARVIFAFVLALLFLLGAQIGADAALLRALPETGLQALLLTLGALAGSIACLRIIGYILHKFGAVLPGSRDV